MARATLRVAPGHNQFALWAGFALCAVFCGLAHAQNGTGKMEAAGDLAKKLANPIAALISVPFQYNHDEKLGPAEAGSKNSLNIQPVIPLALNVDWNLITRTILPLIDLRNFPVDGSSEAGLGDVLASQFFSPKRPTSSGWIWGAGPVESLPTASVKALGIGKWALGPTFVALKQVGPATYGLLANHLWSVAGDGNRADVNSTFLQPFFAYVTKTKTTFGVNLESAYDWRGAAWSVPVNLTVAQLLKVGPQIVSLTCGVRYWASSAESGPEGWGWRLVVTLLFPR